MEGTRSRSKHGHEAADDSDAGPDLSAYAPDAERATPAYALAQGAEPAVSLFGSTPVQPKLAVGSVGDPYEREADAVADSVSSGREDAPTPSISTLAPHSFVQPKREEEEERTPAEVSSPEPAAQEEREEEPGGEAATVQRAPDEGEGTIAQAKRRGPERKKKKGEEEEEAEARTESAIKSGAGGEPLEASTRERLETGMGQDFSDVRVHRGAQADGAARAIGARAFTNRNHVWLASGEKPNDTRLLAHELTHVVQQGGVARRPPRKRPDESGSTPEETTNAGTEPGAAAEGGRKPAPKPATPATRPGTEAATHAGTPATTSADVTAATPAGSTAATAGTTATQGSATGESPSASKLEPRETDASTKPAPTSLTPTPDTPPASAAPPSGTTPSTPTTPSTVTSSSGAASPLAEATTGAAPDAVAQPLSSTPTTASGSPVAGGEQGEAATGGATAGEAATGETATGEAAAGEAQSGEMAGPETAGGAAGGAGGAGGEARGEAAGGGGSVPGAAGGEAEGGGTEEQGAAEMEERMAAAEERTGAGGAAGGEAAGETEEAEPAGVVEDEPAGGLDGAAGGGFGAAGGGTVADDAAAGAGGDQPGESDVAEVDKAGDELAAEERAEERAEEQTPADISPSDEAAAGLDAGGGGAPADAGVGTSDEAAAGGAGGEAVGETAGGEAATGGEAAGEGAAGAAGGELSPAERGAAMSSLAEGGGGEGAAGGGGGGGGGAVAEKQEPEPPDVSGMEPAAAMGALSGLSPAKLVVGLAGVGASVNRSVGDERTELASSPPEMERPSGSPVTKQGPTDAPPSPSEQEAAARTEEAPEGASHPVPEPEPLPPPPPAPTQAVAEPQIRGGGEQGEMTDEEVGRLQSSVGSLPTSDPGLDVDAGEPPPLELTGDADPAQADEQRANLEASITETQEQGARDAAQPLGEDEIYPSVPRETLKASIPGAGGGAGGAGGEAGAAAAGDLTGGEAGEAASIIAAEKSGGEIQAAVGQAQGDMAAERQRHGEKVAEEKAKTQEEISAAEAENAAAQEGERSKAKADVQQARADWTAEQEQVVEENREKADEEMQKGDEEIVEHQEEGEQEAAEAIEEGNEEAAEAREEGEAEAEAEKAKAEEQSSGFFGWLASKAKAFFDGIKNAIKAAFEAARKAVKAAIEKAKQLAVAAIEAARKAIVDVIRRVGDALIALGDVLLAAFPGLRDKWRKFIEEKVAAAEAAVNKLAEDLKAGVQKLLDLLGAALDAALGLLEKGLLAAVDAVNAVVQGAIKAAQAVAEALGAFLVLVKDVSANPGQWLSNLGSSAADGVRNHLWGAFKSAVKQWFNQKLEEVLGLGMAVFKLLFKGGIQMAEIGTMAFEAVKAAIPSILIGLIIEKVVSMIIPAAGAVLAIIEGLQAAWGTVSRIISAFSLFMAFLKQVKTGNAGPQFANAVAAAAIVVIDFVANWLLARLRKPASKVAGKLKAMAQRIMKKLKKAASKVGRRVRGAARRAAQSLRRFGGRLFGGKKKRKGRRGDRRRKKEDKEKRKRDRLERAVRAIQPKLTALLRQGPSKLRLRATLAIWKIGYRLSSLSVDESGTVLAAVNPSMTVGRGIPITDEELGRMLFPLYKAAVEEAMAEMRADPARGQSITAAEQSVIGGQGLPAGATRSEQITALHGLQNPRYTHGHQGPLPIAPGVEASSRARTLVSGQLQVSGRPYFPGAYAGSVRRLRGMTPQDRAAAEGVFRVLPIWESAREPGAAIPYALRDAMDRKDPLHPNLTKAQQFGGELPGFDRKNQRPVGRRREGVLNPMAPVGAVDITETRPERSQMSLEFSVGVISRMVMEAARGNKAYKHGGTIPPRLAQAMERFVTATRRRLKNRGRVSDRSMAGLRGELMSQLKLFFKSL
ncbi:MAG TPA: DUF4157 domain-containing protein [Pyrinomonadaceae bacterium]|nr:DUF4157 domain-containing protein [Pyrinomonadaceae bacterium]